MQSGDCGVGAGVLFPDGLIVGNGPGRPFWAHDYMAH